MYVVTLLHCYEELSVIILFIKSLKLELENPQIKLYFLGRIGYISIFIAESFIKKNLNYISLNYMNKN